MNRKLARWTARAVAAAALPVAAIVPVASSASAATLQHTVTTAASTAGLWIPLETYYGAVTPQGDQLLCALGYVNHWQYVYPAIPESDFRCYGPVYNPDYGWTSTLEVFL
jgi:hypothetical protein